MIDELKAWLEEEIRITVEKKMIFTDDKEWIVLLRRVQKKIYELEDKMINDIAAKSEDNNERD